MAGIILIASRKYSMRLRDSGYFKRHRRFKDLPIVVGSDRNIEVFSATPLRTLRLGGSGLMHRFNRRDAEYAEVTQRRTNEPHGRV